MGSTIAATSSSALAPSLARSTGGWSVWAGLLVAYLNIDEVIRIIREEDEPKAVMMARWDLTDLQAESILNMRLRSLRKLEEFEIRKEFDALSSEKAQIEALLGSETKQWKTVRWEVEKTRDRYSNRTELGARRTTFADAPERDLGDIHQAMIERSRSRSSSPKRLGARLKAISPILQLTQGRRRPEGSPSTRRRPTRSSCDDRARPNARPDKLPGGRGMASRSASSSTWKRPGDRHRLVHEPERRLSSARRGLRLRRAGTDSSPQPQGPPE